MSPDDSMNNEDAEDDAPPAPRKPSTTGRTRPTTGRTTGARPAARSGTTGARPKSASSQASRPAAPPPDNDATNIKSMEDIRRSSPRSQPGRPAATGPRPAARQAPARPAAPPPRKAETQLDPSDINYVPVRDHSGLNTNTGQIVAPEQVVEDFREFMGVLGLSDKVAFVGALGIVISAFMPWKETAKDGDMLGLMSLGLVAVLGALAILGTIAVRVRRFMPNLNVLIPWMAQLGLSIGCVVWCIIFMKISYDATEVPSPIGNSTIMNSSPSIGAYVGLLGALGCLAGTLLGLKEKPAS